MSELNREEINAICSEIARDMCTHPKYSNWLHTAFTQSSDRWYSVVAEVAKQDCPTDQFKRLPESHIRVFVYTCIKGPLFKSNGEVLILFKLANSMWSQLISCSHKNNGSEMFSSKD